MKFDSITELIGNTPLVKIQPEVHGLKNIELYAKLEMYNPFGSLKDRIGWGMIKDDLESIKQKSQVIIESSSGNTAKALAVLASINGMDFTTVTNRINVPEVKKILQVIGANIEELPGLSECPDITEAGNPVDLINQRQAAEPDKYYHTSQYTNDRNHQSHFETTGPEILADLEKVDFFVATLGTTGSSRGTTEYLKQHNPQLQAIGVMSTKTDFIPGIRNEDETYEVGIYKPSLYDQELIVDSMESLEAMRELIRKVGILAGPTSGASYLGALKYLREIDSSLTVPKTAVFIVCDRFEWYLSYIEKRKPEWFGYGPKPNSIRAFKTPQDTSAVDLPLDQIDSWISQHKPLIIDVRGALGFRAGHIPGSINITDKVLTDMLDDGVPFDKAQNLLFVCPSGDLSSRFAAYMYQLGFVSKNLRGGLLGWRQAGRVLERGG